MSNQTALGEALKQAVQTMSKRRQADMVAEHIYAKYDVFNRFKPLAVGIEQELVQALPQFDPKIINRVLSNHCRRPRYVKSVARGGKRFNLNNRFQGEVTPEEQAFALEQPGIREAIERQDARRAEAAERKTARANPAPAADDTPQEKTAS
nr:ProQ/FINO family protein [Conchiformibius kuhniae]